MRRHFIAAGALLALALACKSVGPDYDTPRPELPAVWQESASTDAFESSEPALTDWWQHLQDPLLDELVVRATHQSLDLREALARVAEARALRGGAAADRWPTVDALASYERQGESDNTPFGSFVPDSDLYTAGLDAAWELDLWGRVRRSVEAADADLAATVEDARDVSVVVASEVAFQYVELRALQRRLEIAQRNLSLQQQTHDLVQGRYEAGLVGQSDVAQARTNLEATRARLPEFEASLRAAQNRLAVLLGQPPGTLAAELEAVRPIPVPPLSVAVGVPADLLRRRADVRRAERELAAETARIGVAEGDLYPRLTLHGELGLSSDDLSNFTDSESGFFGFGPSLRWNVFDAGRLKSRVAAQEARTEQALARWERSVLLALEESENAMTAFLREQARRASLLEATSQAQLAVELARTQYTEGLSDFQTVLVALRAQAELEDQLAVSEATIAANFVALTKALGGGWDQGGLRVARAD
jgi:NodT family efflux transporter outer membrane factor (OMF) lipoprotein